MQFTIENGLDICAIGLSDVGSYLRFKHPLAVVWNDNAGSVGRYFAVLPYNKAYREAVESRIRGCLTDDFSGDEERLHELLRPLFPLFRSGTYSLDFYANKEKEFFQYRTSADNCSAVHYQPYNFIFAEQVTDARQTDAVEARYQLFVANSRNLLQEVPGILDHTTDNIFYDSWVSFFATQPTEYIDQERVSHFEQMIASGERPFALLFNASLVAQDYDYDSAYFILDGHHKLLAYSNLKICPPVALITHLPKDTTETEFDIEKLNDVLYPWQMKDILWNWDEKDKYAAAFIQYDFARKSLFAIKENGREYYEDGEGKSASFHRSENTGGPAQEGRLRPWNSYIWEKLRRFFS